MKNIFFRICFWFLVIMYVSGIFLDLCFPRRTSIFFIIGAIGSVIILLRAKAQAEKDIGNHQNYNGMLFQSGKQLKKRSSIFNDRLMAIVGTCAATMLQIFVGVIICRAIFRSEKVFVSVKYLVLLFIILLLPAIIATHVLMKNHSFAEKCLIVLYFHGTILTFLSFVAFVSYALYRGRALDILIGLIGQ